MTEQDKRNIETARRMYTGEAGEQANVAPDIVWHVPGHNPVSGDYQGFEEYTQLMPSRMAPLTSWSFEPQDIMVNGDYVVATVRPADPRLVPTVVVGGPQHERGLLATDPAGLGALAVQPAPEPDESVLLPLGADRRGVGVPRVDGGLVRQRHENVHDRAAKVLESGRARRARNRFGSLLAIGLTAIFLYHVLVNVCMTVGLAPVTGLPLPLLSYGGTSLLTSFLQIGLIQNVAMRWREY